MGNGCMKKTKVVEVKSPTLPAFKVVVVGDSGSGKTSIIRRFVENRFEYEYKRTTDVAITSVVKKLNVPEHVIVTVELWDVPGQNDVDLRKTYYLDVDAVIVVIDISQEDSLSVAGSWSLDVADHARVSRTFTESIPNPDGTFAQKIRKEYLRPKIGSIPILLLGNKYDLAKLEYLKHLEDSDKQNGIIPRDQTTEPPIPEADSPDENQKTNDAVVQNNTVEDSTVDSEVTIDVTNPLSQHKEKDSILKPSPEVTNDQEDGDSVKNKVENDQEATDGVQSKMSNGQVTNGNVPDHTIDAVNQLEKIHPKDLKTFTNNMPTDTVTMLDGPANSVADDAKSAVTMTNSVVSILPPCVEEIDRVAEKFGFIAGVPVSAKTANGGVPEAIQSVLRRLVAEKILKLDTRDAALGKYKNSDIASTKSAKSGRSKASSLPKKKFNSDSEPLQEVGIIEIDEVIRRCNPVVHDAEELTTSYAEAAQSFKMACYTNGFIGTTRVSLEAGVSCLKEAVENDFRAQAPTDPRENIKLILKSSQKDTEEKEAWTLVATDRDVFPALSIVNSKRENLDDILDEKPQINPKILKVLLEYQEKLFIKSVSVIKHGGDVEALLEKLTSEIAAQEEKAWETAVAAGLPSEEVKKILSILAQDKARLRGTTDLIRDTKRSVQSSIAKIKAALLF